MIVYVVVQHLFEFGTEVIGVFSNLEAAVKDVKKFNDCENIVENNSYIPWSAICYDKSGPTWGAKIEIQIWDVKD